jgi:hypothetical protein
MTLPSEARGGAVRERFAPGQEVESVDSPTTAKFERIVRAAEPVILTGVLDGWRAPQLWTIDYLSERIGHRVAPVEHYPDGSFLGSWQHREMDVASYLAQLADPAGPPCAYLAQVSIPELFPELLDDIVVPTFLAQARNLGAALFLGSDTTTSLHYHSKNVALLCQVRGSKRVVLVSPRAHGAFWYEPWHSSRFNFSTAGAPSEWPVGPLSDRSGLVRACTVEAGEALYLPLFWGHHVEGLGFGSTVSYFWSPRRTEWLAHPRLALIAALGGAARIVASRSSRR